MDRSFALGWVRLLTGLLLGNRYQPSRHWYFSSFFLFISLIRYHNALVVIAGWHCIEYRWSADQAERYFCFDVNLIYRIVSSPLSSKTSWHSGKSRCVAPESARSSFFRVWLACFLSVSHMPFSCCYERLWSVKRLPLNRLKLLNTAEENEENHVLFPLF